MTLPQPTLSVADALARLLAELEPLPAEVVPLDEAMGRVLAEPVVAGEDLPPFANSAMDGYAVRAQDVGSASEASPVVLQVVGEAFAGSDTLPDIRAGQAVRIMTGAPVPPSADAVVPIERTEHPNPMAGSALPQAVQIRAEAAPGDHVRPAGQDVRRGDIVLPGGRRLRPQDVGMLAAVGAAQLKVRRRPVVAILSTGDELVDVDQPLRPGHIRNVNGYGLEASVLSAGALPMRLGITPDEEGAVKAQLDRAVEGGADLILSSGGVSMGAYDYVRVVVERHGRLAFWKVNIRPGKPLAFGDFRGVPFLGLPGNPVSAFVTFEVFVRPALHRMLGLEATERLKLRVILDAPLVSDGRESYLRSVVRWDDGAYRAALARSQDSSVLSSLVEANALLIVPAGTHSLESGEVAEAWLLPNPA